MIELEIFFLKYIVFNGFCIVRTNVSAAFINKINFRFTYLFVCLFHCNEIVMKIHVCIFLQQMDMILIYGVYGKVENLPYRESFSSPKFQLDRNLESRNLVA